MLTMDHCLDAWIKATGLDQDEVGELAGFTKSHFNKIVRGTNKLDRGKQAIIATALSTFFERTVKPNDLFYPPSAEFISSLRNKADIVPPPHSKGVSMQELAKPVIAALVDKLGLKTVIRLATEVEKDEEARPSDRQRTS